MSSETFTTDASLTSFMMDLASTPFKAFGANDKRTCTARRPQTADDDVNPEPAELLRQQPMPDRTVFL